MECQQGGGELILVWQFGDPKNGLRCETTIMSRAKQKCRDGVVKISHESSFDHNQQHLPKGAVRSLRDVV